MPLLGDWQQENLYLRMQEAEHRETCRRRDADHNLLIYWQELEEAGRPGEADHILRRIDLAEEASADGV